MNQDTALRQKHIAETGQFKPLQYVRTTPFCSGCGATEEHFGVIVAVNYHGGPGNGQACVFLKCIGAHTAVGFDFMRIWGGEPGRTLKEMHDSTRRLLRRLHGK